MKEERVHRNVFLSHCFVLTDYFHRVTTFRILNEVFSAMNNNTKVRFLSIFHAFHSFPFMKKGLGQCSFYFNQTMHSFDSILVFQSYHQLSKQSCSKLF